MIPPQIEAAALTSTTPPTTSTRRRSCDRCYDQKLRCTREGKEGACNRCLKQGAECVYSFRLLRRRHSVAALARSKTPPITAAERQRSSTLPRAGLRAIPEDNPDLNTSDEKCCRPAPSTSTPAPTTTPPSLPWPFDMDWNDTASPLDDLESTHANSISISAAVASIDSALSFDPYPKPGHSMAERTALGIGDPMERCNTDGSNYGSSVGMEGLRDGMCLDRSPQAAIAQLSRLNKRLYPLHQSGCTLAETAAASFSAKPPQLGPMLDGSCLKGVANWFGHLFTPMPLQIPVDYGTKNTGEVVQSVFSASHHMLQILRRLQNQGSSPHDFGRNMGAGVAHTIIHSSQGCNESSNALNRVNLAGHHSHNTIICRLVIACHTLLLHVYISVLVVLQHDVDLLYSYHAPKGIGSVEVEILLVMVVQLCAYLLERQRQAVDVYFTPGPTSPQPTQTMMTPPPTTPPTGNREVVSQLEADIRQRLSRVRQMLRI